MDFLDVIYEGTNNRSDVTSVEVVLDGSLFVRMADNSTWTVCATPGGSDAATALAMIETFLGHLERVTVDDGLSEAEQRDVKRAYHLLRSVADEHA
jgi:hypothetical protein